MKFLIVLVSILVVASATFLPYYPVDDVYAASLGGAKVGLYQRRSDGLSGFPGLYPGFYPGFYPLMHPLRRGGGGSNVYAASLGGAKVGAYTREG